jgi:uncharacterized protein YrrD
LRNSREVLGLSVIHLETGKRIGTVCDLLFDEGQRLRGLLLEDGGFLKRRRYLPIEHVASVGLDAVMANSGAKALPLDDRARAWTGIVSGEKHLRGRQVLLSNGCGLGQIENVYFLEEVGTLVGYELTDGFWSDLTEGRKMLKSEQPLIWGEDVLIAPHRHVLVQVAR